MLFRSSAFDVGETFSGVDYETGLKAAAEFTELVSQTMPGTSPAQAAIAWCAAQDGVTTVIPGARTERQARSNAGAGDLVGGDPLPAELLDGVRTIYDTHLREAIHPRW